MKDRIGLVAVMVMLWSLGPASPARSSIIEILEPGDAYPTGGTYVSATTKIPVTGAEFSTVNSISDGTESIGFSTTMTVLDVGSGWSSWNSPPATESATPTVLWTGGPVQVTLTFSKPLQGFGVEVQPDEAGPYTFTETFYDGTTSLGSVVRSVSGNAGALLFAGYDTIPSQPITSVTISNFGSDFAIAEPRYQLEPSSVPEPSALMLSLAMALGGLGLAAHLWIKAEGRDRR